MNTKPSLSILVTAYNEGIALKETFYSILRSLDKVGITDYEILILTCTRPDGTHDGTPDIADEVAGTNPYTTHYPDNFRSSLGDQYWRGVARTTKDYVIWLPGSNLVEEDSIGSIMSHIGEADSIITYTQNMESRPLLARIVSRCYVVLCNTMFGLHFKYYNGISVHKRELLIQIPWSAQGHAYMAESIVYLAKSGAKMLELPQKLKPTDRKGKAWNLNSVKQSFKSLIQLFWKINFKRLRVKTT